MRVFSALLLSLMLAIASVSMAVARGQTPMGTTMALCIDGSAVTVTLDAEGNPVRTAPHLCPDCLSGSVAFDLPGLVSLPAPVWRERDIDGQTRVTIFWNPAVLAPSARGPPSLSV